MTDEYSERVKGCPKCGNLVRIVEQEKDSVVSVEELKFSKRLANIIEEHSLTLGSKEANVIAKIILPILDYVGVNIDRDLLLECDTDWGVLDFIGRREERLWFMIEAKSWARTLDSQVRSQFKRYREKTKSPLSVLTNGSIWEFWMPYEKKLGEVMITENSLEEALGRIKEYFNRPGIGAGRPMKDYEWESLANRSRRRTHTWDELDSLVPKIGRSLFAGVEGLKKRWSRHFDYSLGDKGDWILYLSLNEQRIVSLIGRSDYLHIGKSNSVPAILSKAGLGADWLGMEKVCNENDVHNFVRRVEEVIKILSRGA
jgi:hypothetical protein